MIRALDSLDKSMREMDCGSPQASSGAAKIVVQPTSASRFGPPQHAGSPSPSAQPFHVHAYTNAPTATAGAV